MREPGIESRIVTLDEYVCEHWGLTPEQVQGIDICDFNRGHKNLPPDKLNTNGRSIAYGDGSFGYQPAGLSQGPSVFFSTMPLDFYLASINPGWMRERLALSCRGIGYAINVFVSKEDLFDDFCETLRKKLPAEIQMNETTSTDNDEKFYGRGGGDGGDFRFRSLVSNASETASEPGQHLHSQGRIKQYTSRFPEMHRLGWIYQNQIQTIWNGGAETTIGLIRSVAELVKEKSYEAHFDLPIDNNGLMRAHGLGTLRIEGIFYKPKGD